MQTDPIVEACGKSRVHLTFSPNRRTAPTRLISIINAKKFNLLNAPKLDR